jgi:hypothetical protein
VLEVALDVPAQVVDQPLDVARQRGMAGDRQRRSFAGQRAREQPRRIRGLDAHRQVRCARIAEAAPLEQARGRDAEFQLGRRWQKRGPTLQLERDDATTVRDQARHRHRLGREHVVDHQHQALDHGWNEQSLQVMQHGRRL